MKIFVAISIVMPSKRQPSEAELDNLAATLRGQWQIGNLVTPWLRKHGAWLRGLIGDDWSWAALADAMTRAGITYKTGRPWTGDSLRFDVHHAGRAPKQRSVTANQVPVPARLADPVFTPPAPEAPQAYPVAANPAAAGISTQQSVPRFKPASLRPYEPPHPPTPEEIEERERQHTRIFG